MPGQIPVERRIGLATAGFRAGLTYHQIRALVLARKLAGGQDELGRWFADREAVERLAAERAAHRPKRPAA